MKVSTVEMVRYSNDLEKVNGIFVHYLDTNNKFVIKVVTLNQEYKFTTKSIDTTKYTLPKQDKITYSICSSNSSKIVNSTLEMVCNLDSNGISSLENLHDSNFEFKPFVASFNVKLKIDLQLNTVESIESSNGVSSINGVSVVPELMGSYYGMRSCKIGQNTFGLMLIDPF